MAFKTSDAEKCISRAKNQMAHGARQELQLQGFQGVSEKIKKLNCTNLSLNSQVFKDN